METAVVNLFTGYSELLDKVRALPSSQVYRNSTPVVTLGKVNLTVWDVLEAGIIGNLNSLLLGERGEGKTQLQNEVKNTYFGGRATSIRMRDNLRVKDLYEVYNLSKLYAGKGTVLDAKEKTKAIGNPLTIIDEINRAHEKVQNQVFDIYDGYIIFDGPNGPEKISLGVPVENDIFYHVSIGSANISPARYTGISPIDSALLDRSHLILNVDNFAPTSIDHAVILAEVTTPKLIDSIQKDHTDEIVEIYRGVKEIKLSVDALVALLFLKKGFDYCINLENPSHSKLPILHMLPTICEGCNELGNGCGYIYPSSVRTLKATALLAKCLKIVADSKSESVQTLRVQYQDVLGAFLLVAPYSGMLDERWVNQQFMGNQQVAINKIVQNVSNDIRALRNDLQESYASAISGKLTSVMKNKFVNRWAWYGDVLVAFNSAAQELGDLTKLSPEEKTRALKQHPVLRWIE